MAIYHIGDLHLGHEKVAEIRGFESVLEHDAAVASVFKVVMPDDVIHIHGDLSNGRYEDEKYALEILKALPGRKRLITGNHDSVAGIHRRPSKNQDLFHNVFERINDFGRIRVEGMDVLLSHYPYASQGDGPGRGHARYLEYRLPDTGKFLIHAHTHWTHAFSGSASGREMCVSWDAWERLVTQADVSKWIREWKDPLQTLLDGGLVSQPFMREYVFGFTNFEPPIYFDEPSQIEFPKE